MSEFETLTPDEAREAGLLPPELTDEQQVEASFQESDSHYWNDVKLDGYSAQRQIAAQAMGLRFGALSKDDLDETERSNSYPGMMQDAIIVLYLCYPRGKNGKDGIEESYAACDPIARKRVRRNMLDWACKEGIEIGSDSYAAAVNLMLAIIKEAKLNQFKPSRAKGIAPPGN